MGASLKVKVLAESGHGERRGVRSYERDRTCEGSTWRNRASMIENPI